VRDARPQIELIADALLEFGSLDGDEIYDLVASASRLSNFETVGKQA
jgi:hypothetical protein